MHKTSAVLLSVFLISFSATPALSIINKDAGSIIKKTAEIPYKAEVDPKFDVTGFMPVQPQKKNDNEEVEIHFSADEMEDNKEQQTITARGNVNIIRENLTLIADKVIYNQKEDVVTAVDNVILVEKDGSVVFSDYLELTDQMTAGNMTNIKIVMKDKTRIAAQKARKMSNDNKVMEKVVYSPCDVCRNSEPLWQLKARKVKHDAASKNINYNDAFLEIKGIPVFYTPYFSHPDPTVKRRSGFLTPSFGGNSYLGASVTPRYFWNISDHEDLTYSPMITSDHGVVQDVRYRKYFYNGDISASGTYMKDKETDKDRGSLFLTGRYELNDYWVSDLDVNYASDRTYLKDLSLPKEDDSWLSSSLKFQGFDNRNYASVEGYYYQFISNALKEIDKPYVVPYFNYENYGKVGEFGAYNKTTVNSAIIHRDEENSSQRLSMINSWNLPYTSPYGEKYRMVASVKTDLYNIDNYTNQYGEKFDGGVARVFPQLGAEWRLPFVRATETSRQILEPTIVAVLAPNGGNKENEIPNDDSQDVELDDTNILDLDRYAGYDRNDTGSRISYGFNWSAYGNRTGRTSAFLGQSYNFSKDESFSQDDMQEGYFSDYVGRINAAPSQYLDLDYRFKLDKDTLELKYSELSSSIGPQLLKAYISYIYLKGDDKNYTSRYRERQELYTVLRSKLTRDWSISIYNRQDLTKNGGSLEHGGSLIYEDECFALLLNVSQDDSTDPDYKGDFNFTANFVLKTLGAAGSK